MAVASSSSTELQKDDLCLSPTSDTMSQTGLDYFMFGDVEMVEQRQQQKATEKTTEIHDLPLKRVVEEQCFPEPPWLHDFLRATYFTSCHGKCSCGTNAHEVYFCISCGKDLFVYAPSTTIIDHHQQRRIIRASGSGKLLARMQYVCVMFKTYWIFRGSRSTPSTVVIISFFKVVHPLRSMPPKGRMYLHVRSVIEK
ncbi:hypothetical protein O6H91_09G080300 [Diphasiastrum complanatum]|uniref:Uncharacterized protein n=2 Tax=Diphasiastrum complanatum TaxID=34168 RepID=A0ACC2CLJ5_DIPCM|nr:hypothetical protein O6H91_09G014000 [Diphasiastrum complanatum]KAJ7544467.1 hypothetical protein O6H91_09G080300 [Diphasiastrum complanatum]